MDKNCCKPINPNKPRCKLKLVRCLDYFLRKLVPIVTVLWKLADHPWKSGWTYFEKWVTILGMVGYHPWADGWPS